MRCCSVGKKKSVYLLLEIRSHQFAYLIELLQNTLELLGVCIGLQIQRRLSLVAKAQVLVQVIEVLAIERSYISTASNTGMPNEAKLLSTFGFTALVPPM